MDKPFTEWLREAFEKDPDNLCDPPIEYERAIHYLIMYLLGEDWYVDMPEHPTQVATAVTYEILKKYSRRFRRELLDYRCVYWDERRFNWKMKLHLWLHPELRLRRKIQQDRRKKRVD